MSVIHDKSCQVDIADQLWQLAKDIGPGKAADKLKHLSIDVREKLIAENSPEAIALYRCPRCHSVSMDKPESLGGDGDLCPHIGGPVRRLLVGYTPTKVID